MEELTLQLQRTASHLIRCNNVLCVTHAYGKLPRSVWIDYWLDLTIEIEMIKEQMSLCKKQSIT